MSEAQSAAPDGGTGGEKVTSGPDVGQKRSCDALVGRGLVIASKSTTNTRHPDPPGTSPPFLRGRAGRRLLESHDFKRKPGGGGTCREADVHLRVHRAYM
ncbi:hypothetical protein CSOJ01_10982 [Colletotrichum sojae]|uniref:Uncharacterized protein n=1 Tax=Colletotrichum sojae TaxID=2175907 RepID=A0A8H6MPE9_9PEZI|nr:hypothetical protein CSOJ01_10982 [Colletotrichum sojae]